MIKKILLFLALILIAGAVLIYFFGSGYLNNAVKDGIEEYGPRMTQTPVSIESVNLSVLSGNGTLQKLHIGNPEGFQTEDIFAVDQIDVAIDTGTLLSETIIIDRIHIQRPAISYERTLSSSNVKELLDNIEAFTGPESPGTDVPEDEGPKKQVVIRELIIEEGTVFVGALGAGTNVRLPRIEMTDIGADNRQTIAQAARIVVAEILKAIGPALANNGEGLKNAGRAALEGAQTKAAQRAGEAAESAAEKAREGLKGLLGE